MLPRTKYNRFRNDSVTSVDDLLHNLSVSGGGKVSAARAAPAAAPYLVSGEALRRAPDDGPGSLGHLLHKVSHLKLSSSGLRGLSAARERAGARLSGSCSAPSLAAPDGSAPPGPRAPAMRAARKGRPGDEPPPRAPHASDQVLGAGVTYVVKYLGCIEVLRSMRSLDFSTRTQITREAISRVCEAVPGSKGAFRKRKPPSKMLSSILGKSNLQFAGMSISLTISTASLNLRTPDSKQIIANHHMQSISFASGGDPDTTDYVAYVAKDPVNRRACHILECCDGLAQDVIGSIGQAFELRFKQYLQCPSKIAALHDRMQSLDEPWTEEESDGSDHPYYNSIPSKTPPPGGFADARLKARPHGPDTAQFAGKEQTYYQGRHLGDPFAEDWQQAPVRQGERQGKVDKKHQKYFSKLMCSLVDAKTRELVKSPAPMEMERYREGQRKVTKECNCSEGSNPASAFSLYWYTQVLQHNCPANTLPARLTSGRSRPPGLHPKQERLLLARLQTASFKCGLSYKCTDSGWWEGLVASRDQSTGPIRTKDRIFDSISHLINHHLENSLPIVSAGSELCLQQPVERNP
ncbi:SHC-transforming protein 3 [Moschus berezovskii]|uniref:SHC-transforming protein 3 n=1 Tax=Moschus berezovskii TaxID=68408 RepID=UPI0024440A6B|nr:SHC-transforming protein 3 [Moschus berezovskii]